MSTNALEIKPIDVTTTFGDGRYSSLMKESFKDSMRVLHVTQDEAVKIAKAIGRDWGAAMASSPVKVKIGKVNKDAKVTLSEAAKMKGVPLTNAIFILRAIQFANEASSFGFEPNQLECNETLMQAIADVTR